MKLKTPIILLLLLGLPYSVFGQLVIEGYEASSFDLISKWQSLNDRNLVIEFTEDDEYIIFRDQKKFLTFKYAAKAKEGGMFEVEYMLEDDISEPAKATIQIVTESRIRLFTWKHHGILDIADEFNRTEDLESFNKIIRKLRKEPE